MLLLTALFPCHTGRVFMCLAQAIGGARQRTGYTGTGAGDVARSNAEDDFLGTLTGTNMTYLAPERMNFEPAGKTSDIWAFGCLACVSAASPCNEWRGRYATHMHACVSRVQLRNLQRQAAVAADEEHVRHHPWSAAAAPPAHCAAAQGHAAAELQAPEQREADPQVRCVPQAACRCVTAHAVTSTLFIEPGTCKAARPRARAVAETRPC